MWSNDTKCKYMFMFPLKNLTRKGLINMQTDVLFVFAAPVLPFDGHKGAVYLKQCSFVTGCTGGIVLLTWRDPSDHNINCRYGLDRILCVHCISVATESACGGRHLYTCNLAWFGLYASPVLLVLGNTVYTTWSHCQCDPKVQKQQECFKYITDNTFYLSDIWQHDRPILWNKGSANICMSPVKEGSQYQKSEGNITINCCNNLLLIPYCTYQI